MEVYRGFIAFIKGSNKFVNVCGGFRWLEKVYGGLADFDRGLSEVPPGYGGCINVF